MIGPTFHLPLQQAEDLASSIVRCSVLHCLVGRSLKHVGSQAVRNGMAPRRSSRALAAQPSNSSQQMTHSSSSSATSGRAERHTRSRTKTSSPQKPATPRSRPFEGAATATQARGDRLPSQRPKRKRGSTDDDLGSDPVKDTDNEAAGADEDRDEDEDEDEETTRCVCGLQDYPGPPFPVALRPEPVTDEDHLGQSSKSTADAGTEEPGSLFIQCDICQVWQHGGCVGIMHVDMSPDEYFCELCRGDLHNLVAESKGYVPSLLVHRSYDLHPNRLRAREMAMLSPQTLMVLCQ